MVTANHTHNKRTVVGVSMSPADLALLDAQAAQLGSASRATALKQLWAHVGDAALQRHQDVVAADAAEAESVEPLIDALHEASQAWHERARQRRAIGVQLNQLARFCNVLAAAIRRGDVEDIGAEQINGLVVALRGINRKLIGQMKAESGDDDVLAAVREIITPTAASSRADAA